MPLLTHKFDHMSIYEKAKVADAGQFQQTRLSLGTFRSSAASESDPSRSYPFILFTIVYARNCGDPVWTASIPLSKSIDQYLVYRSNAQYGCSEFPNTRHHRLIIGKCDECRKRKIRCDRKTPCGQCRSASLGLWTTHCWFLISYVTRSLSGVQPAT